jgi:hypothetical protein
VQIGAPTTNPVVTFVQVPPVRALAVQVPLVAPEVALTQENPLIHGAEMVLVPDTKPHGVLPRAKAVHFPDPLANSQ